MKTPDDKEFAFEFRSVAVNPIEARWVVRVVFPAGSTAETKLPIDAMDGNDRPVADGWFEVSGRKVRITNGKAEMLFSDFVAGKHETAIWMYRKGMDPVPGELTFA